MNDQENKNWRMNRREFWARTCAAALALPAVATAAGSQPTDGARPGLTPYSSPRLEGYFPDVPLLTHEGRTVRFYNDLLRDRAVIVNFTYTRCTGTCPGTIRNLKQVQALLGDNLGTRIHMLSFTLDPEKDDAATLGKYAGEVGARPGWTFLTGEWKHINAIRRKFGLYDLDPAVDADRKNHSAMLVYGNEPIGRWGAMPGSTRPEFFVSIILDSLFLGHPA